MNYCGLQSREILNTSPWHFVDVPQKKEILSDKGRFTHVPPPRNCPHITRRSCVCECKCQNHKVCVMLDRVRVWLKRIIVRWATGASLRHVATSYSSLLACISYETLLVILLICSDTCSNNVNVRKHWYIYICIVTQCSYSIFLAWLSYLETEVELQMRMLPSQ